MNSAHGKEARMSEKTFTSDPYFQHSITDGPLYKVRKSINRSINQWINRSINQAINQSMDQEMNREIPTANQNFFRHSYFLSNAETNLYNVPRLFNNLLFVQPHKRLYTRSRAHADPRVVAAVCFRFLPMLFMPSQPSPLFAVERQPRRQLLRRGPVCRRRAQRVPPIGHGGHVRR